MKNRNNLFIATLLILCICCACAGCGTKSNDAYGSTIANLGDDDTYAFLEMDYKNDVLVTTNMIYDEGTENQAALYCDVYYAVGNTVSYLGTISSDGTAYPLKFTKSGIYVSSGHGIVKYVISEKEHFLIIDNAVYEIFDESGNATYQSESNGTTKTITENEYQKMIEEYAKAQIIHFSYGADGCINEYK